MNKLSVKENLDLILSSTERTDQKLQSFESVSIWFTQILYKFFSGTYGLNYSDNLMSLDEKVRIAFADGYDDVLTWGEKNQYLAHEFLKPNGYFYEFARWYFVIGDNLLYSGFCRFNDSSKDWRTNNPEFKVEQTFLDDLYQKNNLNEIVNSKSYRVSLDEIFSPTTDCKLKYENISNVALLFLEELNWIEYEMKSHETQPRLEVKVQLAFTSAYSDFILGKELKRFLINDELKPQGSFYELAYSYLLLRKQDEMIRDCPFSMNYFSKEVQMSELKYRAKLA